MTLSGSHRFLISITSLLTVVAMDRGLYATLHERVPPPVVRACEDRVRSAARASRVIIGASQIPSGWHSHSSTGNDLTVRSCPGATLGEALDSYPLRGENVVLIWAGWNDMVRGFTQSENQSADGFKQRLKSTGFGLLAVRLTRPVRVSLARQEARSTLRGAPVVAEEEWRSRAKKAGRALAEYAARQPSEVRITVVLPPWAGRDASTEFFEGFARTLPISLNDYAAAHSALTTELRRLCEESTRLDCLDLAGAVEALTLADRNAYFIDPFHWSEAGNHWSREWLLATTQLGGSGTGTAMFRTWEHM